MQGFFTLTKHKEEDDDEEEKEEEEEEEEEEKDPLSSFALCVSPLPLP